MGDYQKDIRRIVSTLSSDAAVAAAAAAEAGADADAVDVGDSKYFTYRLTLT